MGRPIRGARHAAFFPPDPAPSLAALDSAFQLQEYIALRVRADPRDVEGIVALPGRDERAGASEKEKGGEQGGEEGGVVVDEACWIYEQLRRLAQDLTHPLITTLQQECTRQTCPEMKAGEWLYLCVAHGNSGAMEHCCAIDYILHTLDSATALLASPRAFPSRLSIPPTSHRHFPSLARRLGRIFAHAYHHHRAAFESAEAEGALYARFLALSRRFDLVPAEFLVIPPRQAGEADVTRDMQPAPVPVPVQPPSPPPASASPRIGGRARTDTMFLSGDFVPPIQDGSPSASPRRGPSPLAGTLFAGHEREREPEKEKEKETEKETEKEKEKETETEKESEKEKEPEPEHEKEQGPEGSVDAEKGVVKEAKEAEQPARVVARDFGMPARVEDVAPAPEVAAGSVTGAEEAQADTPPSEAATPDTADAQKAEDEPSAEPASSPDPAVFVGADDVPATVDAPEEPASAPEDAPEAEAVPPAADPAAEPVDEPEGPVPEDAPVPVAPETKDEAQKDAEEEEIKPSEDKPAQDKPAEDEDEDVKAVTLDEAALEDVQLDDATTGAGAVGASAEEKSD